MSRRRTLTQARIVEGGARRQTVLRHVTIVLALVTLVLLGMRQEIQYTLTTGYATAALLTPIWLPSVRRYWGATIFMIWGGIALISGVWLAWMHSSVYLVERSAFFGNSMLLFGLLLTVGIVAWARQLMPTSIVALAYGIGMLLGVNHDGRAAENPWKFGYSMAVTIIVLAMVMFVFRSSPMSNRAAAVVVLGMLALVSAHSDARSLFAMLGLALILVLWQFSPPGNNLRRSVARTALGFSAITVVTYNVVVSMLVGGMLGQDAQQRTLDQIHMSGSLLVGGRPELAASVALFFDQPWGHGIGVVPSLHDIWIAKSGMAAINYQPDNGYVENYMFGQAFELHSVTGDLWSWFGMPGLVLVALMLMLLLRWVFVAVAVRGADGLILFLAVYGLWNLLFSPFFSAVTILGLALGMMILPRRDLPDGSLGPAHRAMDNRDDLLGVRGRVVTPSRFN